MGIKLKHISHHSAMGEEYVYGATSSYVYEDGDLIKEPSKFKRVIVMARVGGGLQNSDHEGVVTKASALTVFPHQPQGEAVEVEGKLETTLVPTQKRVEEFTLELAQLACGETVSPVGG